ncbi:hypothetical protein ACFQU2_04205 [Siccirubricoccus deserti]|uniref:Uncharacterized protein n=1 Tax=Siccirubricoccus deserti TaxID=2013562 RepID=A0A9X0UFT6_9PROT|nr:hypothetical protein [Siccirubricoccus deserti]MBC4018311.1 hypothetical protein [Siccirubricoccus deserti]
MAELSGRAGGMPATMALLNEYQQRLDPRLLRAAGGDRVSRRQLAAVPR